MRISRKRGRITLRDRPAPYGALGLFLLAGGLLGIVAPLGLATNAGELQPWERLSSVGLGVGVAVGALWSLKQNPATEVRLDLTRGLLTLVRSSVLGRQVRHRLAWPRRVGYGSAGAVTVTVCDTDADSGISSVAVRVTE
jgi:hypothetical protein